MIVKPPKEPRGVSAIVKNPPVVPVSFAPVGLCGNWESRNEPNPVALTVVPLILAMAVPCGLLELPTAEAVAPAGAGGRPGHRPRRPG